MEIRHPGLRDQIAARGEAIFSVIITRHHTAHGFLFDVPRHLGEKKRSIDFYVELFQPSEVTPFFLVQVKSTRQGYTAHNRLKVGIGAGEIRRLAAYPAPTYVVGIDESSERGYIVSANGEKTAGFSSMCTEYPLAPDVLLALHHEVAAYWAEGPDAFTSSFVDPDPVRQ